MTKEDLERRTDDELLGLWQRMTGIFNSVKNQHAIESHNNLSKTQHSVAGLLALSRETKRRGLELVETKFGKIIFQPIKETA